MLHLLSFAALILCLVADHDDQSSSNLLADGGGCNPGDDPCFECFACNEYGRCVPVEGCVPSCYSDDDCTRNQICSDNICALPGGRPSGGGSGSHRPGGSKGSGQRRGGQEGANAMGQCQYDGSLGLNSASATYEAECRRLSMAECMTTGPRGRCTYIPAEDSQIGCVWNGSGCAMGCVPAEMELRCRALSHDQSACEGAEGEDLRCEWSKAGEPMAALSLSDRVRLFAMDSALSTRDVLLVLLLAVTALFGLYQLYRRCVNFKLHREYKIVNTSDRPSHCIIDGQVYF